MLSQFNESEIISEFLGNHCGTFVDIGASGGVALSNTFELGLKGWHGLLVEASPMHFQNLLQNYIHRGGFKLVNAALWTERKVMPFHLNPHFYSSLKWKDEPNLFIGTYHVMTITPADLASIQPHCDFLSVDIEGADVDVFPALMTAYPMCRLVCVEHAKDDGIKERWSELFAKHGLSIVAETPENFLAGK